MLGLNEHKSNVHLCGYFIGIVYLYNHKTNYITEQIGRKKLDC